MGVVTEAVAEGVEAEIVGEEVEEAVDTGLIEPEEAIVLEDTLHNMTMNVSDHDHDHDNHTAAAEPATSTAKSGAFISRVFEQGVVATSVAGIALLAMSV